MSLPYRYVADSAVLDFFSGCTHRERDELMKLFSRLAGSPHESGAWVSNTREGRELLVRRLGRWLVTYWPDDAVSEVRIVFVEKVLT